MQADLDRFDSRRSTVYGQRGVVATSQPLAAQAGISILEDCGNAFDAAVATAAALTVVEPTSTVLGGDVFALFRTADGEVGAMRACGGAPSHATIENVRESIAERTGEDPEDVEMPSTGPHAVTVPGTARGWEASVERYGRRGHDVRVLNASWFGGAQIARSAAGVLSAATDPRKDGNAQAW